MKDLSLLNLPEKPKKPATTFIRFVVSVRPKILEGNPELPQTGKLIFRRFFSICCYLFLAM